ncbi:hypothetical protein DAPPUDRAFT_334694 [Daphnia pulex]|uniref:Uncharacterized protein n=1 Tax=Daphnia pulex TaxID=6669 RepID=E9HW74_DAPPU|nr:hypothetical protein DAPPUDRAFT_334694 [Daphnia pulex]|eukprot:EFX64001.1 hypothetical protein DAPPUDRAFT_334694 [Daphnia pulex]
MFFQTAPQPTIAAQPAPQPVPPLTAAIKPGAETPSKASGTRPLSTILPSSSGASTAPTPIRPASSMSNQTFAGGVVTNAQTGNPRPAGKTKKVGRPPQNHFQYFGGLFCRVTYAQRESSPLPVRVFVYAHESLDQ